uniref:endo-polygalacturonase n=1 Tax=Lygus lineolaris TaxID=50650 RepID=A0A126CR15_LYGLI|nr:polygalacturonase 9 [Lygus lineolaris]
MKPIITSFGSLVLVVAIASAFELNQFEQLDAAKKSADKRIVIKNLVVPAGKMLDLTNLQQGTVIEFEGRLTFGYQEWDGTMIRIKGKNIRVVGKPGNLLDGEGHRWWDKKGGNGGKKKPRFIEVNLEDSLVTGLNIKNPPRHCFVANYCKNVRIEYVNIDIKDGDTKGGHNTDGFGVGGSQNVTVANCKVHNQDDCFCTGSGSDTIFENNVCTGGHGISIGSMGNGQKVERVLVRNCQIIRNTNGIRIKSRKGETGLVRDVTFENIEMKDISKYGIIIQANYLNGGPKGDPTPFPMENIIIKNVRGTVSRKGTNTLVWVAPGSAKNWQWNSSITGGQREVACKGVPQGLNFPCGKK